MSNFLIWHKTNFATLTPDEIKTLKAKMLKLPTMPMDIFKKVLGNIDEKYPFTMSPKLILALLVLTGLCTIIIGILIKERLSSGIKERLPSLPLQWGTCLS